MSFKIIENVLEAIIIIKILSLNRVNVSSNLETIFNPYDSTFQSIK